MSKRFTRSLGPSANPPPPSEIVLAKLIQTAASRGLKSCTGTFFRDRLGWSTDEADATFCCASGANELDPENPAARYPGMPVGNDAPEGEYPGYGIDYDIGAAFEHALRPNRRK